MKELEILEWKEKVGCGNVTVDVRVLPGLAAEVVSCDRVPRHTEFSLDHWDLQGSFYLGGHCCLTKPHRSILNSRQNPAGSSRIQGLFGNCYFWVLSCFCSEFLSSVCKESFQCLGALVTVAAYYYRRCNLSDPVTGVTVPRVERPSGASKVLCDHDKLVSSACVRTRVT